MWQLEAKYLFFTKDKHILVDMDGSNRPNYNWFDLSDHRLGYLCPAIRPNLLPRSIWKFRRVMEWLDESPKNTS